MNFHYKASPVNSNGWIFQKFRKTLLMSLFGPILPILGKIEIFLKKKMFLPVLSIVGRYFISEKNWWAYDEGKKWYRLSDRRTDILTVWHAWIYRTLSATVGASKSIFANQFLYNTYANKIESIYLHHSLFFNLTKNIKS